MVGDSYVEAFQVDYNKSLSEILRAKLGSDKYEVFRFGISGAPLSQYLHVFRTEILKYAPDLLIFILVHNDFSESFRYVPGRYTSSFLKLALEKGAVKKEIAPSGYLKRWYEPIRRTSLFRYFYYRQNVNINFLKKSIFHFYSEDKNKYEANIDVKSLKNEFQDIIVSTNYIFKKLKSLGVLSRVELLLVADGVRQKIYSGVKPEPSGEKGAAKLNSMARRLAKTEGIPFLDLHPVFRKMYEKEKKDSTPQWMAIGMSTATRLWRMPSTGI